MPNPSRYNFKEIEIKWQNQWERDKIFESKINSNKKILLFRNVSLSIW